MERIRLGLVGCGGAGRRHLAGYAELMRTDFQNVELVGVCDLNERNAEALADEAGKLTGTRPRVFQSITTMTEAIDGLRCIDITTDSRAHHRVAIECLDRGLHIQIEKPLALTMRACNLIIRAAQRTGRLIAVAENARRDPMNRLVKALIDDDAIGEPHMMTESLVRGADRIQLTPWRHQRTAGGIALNLGVHSAGIMRYFLGEVDSAAGLLRQIEPVRRPGAEQGAAAYYGRWRNQLPSAIAATAEDALWATIRFQNGAVAQWTLNTAGRGLNLRQRFVHGSRGWIAAPADESGRSIRLYRDRELGGDDLLEHAPGYRLCPPAAQLFESERPTSYRYPFAEVDRKLFALAYHELGECVLHGHRPEMTGEEGRRDIALVYAVCESARAGRFVSVDDVEDLRVDQFQREIDADLGLIELPGYE